MRPHGGEPERSAPGAKRARTMLRAPMLLIAVAGLAWSATSAVEATRAAALSEIAERTLAGQKVGLKALNTILQVNRPTGCSAAEQAEALTIISFARTRQVLASRIFAEEQLADLEERAMAALECHPHRPLPWYLLFWARTQRLGYQAEHLPLLEMSYRLGPHEAWLQALRAPFLMNLFDELPQANQRAALADYENLLRTGLFIAAAQSLTNAPSEIRAEMLAAANRIPPHDLQRFGMALRTFDSSVEGSQSGNSEQEQWAPHLEALERIRSLLQGAEDNR